MASSSRRSPIVLLDGAALLNDLVVASFLLAAVVFLTGRSRAELALGSLALGLALSTKFTALLGLPLVVAVVLSLFPRAGVSKAPWPAEPACYSGRRGTS